MATPLSKDLRPASFRGVPFQVEGTDIAAGRRTEPHEYPKRDKPFVEDLGRSARELSFEAFVVGADYVAQANALLAAVEEGGPGSLVHPWFGTLTVSIKDPARISFSTALGYARVSLSFIESGELAFPAAGDATTSQSRIAAVNIENAAVDDFASVFTVDGFQDFVTTDALASINDALDQVSGATVGGADLLGYAATAQAALGTALGLLGDPAALGQSIAGALGVSGLSTTAQRWGQLAATLVRLAQSISVPSAPTVYTPSRQQAYENAVATNALVRQVLLAQAVGATSLAPATVYDDAVLLRNGLAAALDVESLTATDATYAALQDARGTVWRDLTERSRSGARLTTRTLPETMPALVLAYDLYEAADRDGEIVARNAVRHPGFVPPAPLKVLTV
jgi:prophage DNA circulation protein